MLSLSILAVVIIWSYRLGVRDANDIPVIRARQEVTKMRPDTPGGLDVAHQDRAVYGVVSGAGAPEAETGFAPPAEGLAAEDVAAVAVAPAPTPRPADAPAAAPAEDAAPAAETTPSPAPAPNDEVVAAAPAPEAPRPTAPSADIPTPAPAPAAPVINLDAAPDPAPAEAAPAAVEPAAEPEIAAIGPAPKAAPPARARPVIAARVKPQEEAPEPRAAALASRIQIQLGAFNSEDIAAEQWTGMKTRNGDLLSGRGRVITPVVSGGRRLYRLRAGPFATVNEASTLCRALIGRGEDCIVATNQ